MPRVLVIEDEETLRKNVVRGLSKLPGVEVVGAASMAEALSALDSAPPDVILSDLDLPDRPGVELIGELGRRGLRCPITFVSAYTRAFAAQIPRHAQVQVVDKPAPLEKLRDIVRQHLSLEVQASAEPAPFGVADYLQLACMGQHSVLIAVSGAARDEEAHIIVHRGVLWSAQDAQGEGEAAFARLVNLRGRRVTVRALSEPPGTRNVHASWEGLLIDAVRSADEAARDQAFQDGLITGQFFALEPAAAEQSASEARKEAERDRARDFEEACELGVASLLRKDYPAALSAFRKAESIHPEDRKVAANLRRLTELGFGDNRAAAPEAEHAQRGST